MARAVSSADCLLAIIMS